MKRLVELLGLVTAPAPRKSEFLAPLTLRRRGVLDSGQWTVVGRFGFYSALLGREIWIEDGEETDLASVPRLPLMYELCGNLADEPAVLHDGLYRSATVTRAQADHVFAEAIGVVNEAKRQAAKDAGAGTLRLWLMGAKHATQRGLMWAGVRVGGRRYYGNPNPPPERVDVAAAVVADPGRPEAP